MTKFYYEFELLTEDGELLANETSKDVRLNEPIFQGKIFSSPFRTDIDWEIQVQFPITENMDLTFINSTKNILKKVASIKVSTYMISSTSLKGVKLETRLFFVEENEVYISLNSGVNSDFEFTAADIVGRYYVKEKK